jgi:hypothetical protein
MAVRFLALRSGRPFPPGRFMVLIFVRGLVDPRVIVRLEGLGQLKNPMTSVLKCYKIASSSSMNAWCSWRARKPKYSKMTRNVGEKKLKYEDAFWLAKKSCEIWRPSSGSHEGKWSEIFKAYTSENKCDLYQLLSYSAQVPQNISIPYAAFESTASAGLSISFGIRNCHMLMDGYRPTLLQQMATCSLIKKGSDDGV